MEYTNFIYKIEDQLVDQSPKMPVKVPRGGYRTAHLVLNCMCLAIAAHEFYLFHSYSKLRHSGYNDDVTVMSTMDINDAKYVRIIYLAIVTAFTIASAVAHGIGNVSWQPEKAHAKKPVLEAIYYSFCGLWYVILSIALLVKVTVEMEINPFADPFLLTTSVVTFINAMVYLAAAVNASITRRSG